MVEGGSNSPDRAGAKRARMMVRLVLIAIVLVAIVGVAWVTGPMVFGGREIARRRATGATMRSLDAAVRSYKAEKGRYPPSIQTLVDEKYFDKAPRDAWDRDMTYVVPGRDGRDYSLDSAGEDGKFGTGDDLDVWHLGQ